jgi:hypothetical protein
VSQSSNGSLPESALYKQIGAFSGWNNDDIDFIKHMILFAIQAFITENDALICILQ